MRLPFSFYTLSSHSHIFQCFNMEIYCPYSRNTMIIICFFFNLLLISLVIDFYKLIIWERVKENKYTLYLLKFLKYFTKNLLIMFSLFLCSSLLLCFMVFVQFNFYYKYSITFIQSYVLTNLYLDQLVETHPLLSFLVFYGLPFLYSLIKMFN